MREVAAVRGDRSFARDRDPGAALGPDGRPWGKKSPSLPERSAALRPSQTGRLPDHTEADAAAADRAALEPLLSDFLGGHRETTTAPAGGARGDPRAASRPRVRGVASPRASVK